MQDVLHYSAPKTGAAYLTLTSRDSYRCGTCSSNAVRPRPNSRSTAPSSGEPSPPDVSCGPRRWAPAELRRRGLGRSGSVFTDVMPPAQLQHTLAVITCGVSP